MKKYFLFPALLFALSAKSQAIDTSLWVPNNIVTVMSRQGDMIYMAGGFVSWGLNRPFAAVVDSASGAVNPGFPRPNGVVLSTEPDGNGGYFIAGGFSLVGDSARAGIAHVDRYGQVTGWNPFVTGGSGIYALHFDGSTLYLGGQFTTVNGQTRNNIAAMDTLGNLLAWNPNANNIVDHIERKNNKIYVSGFFSVIGGQSRNYLAQLDALTGLATVWNPNPNGYANGGFKAYGDRFFVSGQFSTIGSASRSGLAALDTITGLAFPFDAHTGCTDLLPSGDSLIICGYFTVIDSMPRMRFAVVDTATGDLRNWQPGFDAVPLKLFLSGNTLYVGGQFRFADSTRRNSACSFDMTTGQLTGWDPSCGSEVVDFCKTNSGICIAGRYTCINAINRYMLAGYDVVTNTFSPLELMYGAISGGQFAALLATPTRIYLGGSFSSINNQPRNGLAAIDIQSGALLPWDPAASYPGGAEIYSIVQHDSGLYVGGRFNNIGGQPRAYLACVDTITGVAQPWNPNPNNLVRSLVVHDSLLYVGGNFTTIGLQPHVRLGAVSLSTGAVTSWSPSISGGSNQVNTVHVLDTTVIATGFFTTANSQSRSNVAAFGITSGTLLPLNPVLNGGVDHSAAGSSAIYLTGQFTQVNSAARNKYAAIHPVTGNLQSWDIKASAGGNAIIVDSNKIWTAGFFTTLNNYPRAYFLGVDAVPDTVIVTSAVVKGENDLFRLFPVPASDNITIQLRVKPGNVYTARVFDVTGRTVIAYELEGETTQLNIAGLAPGLYSVLVSNGDGTQTGTLRVVIAR